MAIASAAKMNGRGWRMVLDAVQTQNSSATAATRRVACNRNAMPPFAAAQVGRHGHRHHFSDNTKHPLQQSNTGRQLQPRQGRNRCRNRPPRILSPVRGDIIRTMPLLRSLGFHFGRDSTKMPRLRRCRPKPSDGGHEARRLEQEREAGAAAAH
jgi:hypothetical protein